MRKRDLFKMSVGRYELTDNENNYHYALIIGLNEDNSRYYRILEKGALSGENIFMLESYEEYSYGIKYKVLSALSGVGGLRIHSNDTYSMLSELKLIPRGSFKQFAECTDVQ